MTDHKVAVFTANAVIADRQDTEINNLAAAYLELRELAKEVLQKDLRRVSDSDIEALRKALEE